MTTICESPRLRLRPLEPARDAASMLALLNDPGFLRGIGDRGVRSREQAMTFIEEWALRRYRAHGFGHYAVERRADGVFLGTAGLILRDALAVPDLGYALLQEHAGQGYALEAARMAIAHARSRGIARLCAIVSPDNARSRALLRKLGMAELGMVRLLPGGAQTLLCSLDLERH